MIVVQCFGPCDAENQEWQQLNEYLRDTVTHTDTGIPSIALYCIVLYCPNCIVLCLGCGLIDGITLRITLNFLQTTERGNKQEAGEVGIDAEQEEEGSEPFATREPRGEVARSRQAPKTRCQRLST